MDTRLLADARAAGCDTIGGLEMREDLGHSGRGAPGGISAHLPDGTMVGGISWGHDRVKRLDRVAGRTGVRVRFRPGADPELMPDGSGPDAALRPTPRKLKRNTATPIRASALALWYTALVCIVPP